MNRPLIYLALSGLLLASSAGAGDDPGAEGMRLFLAGKKEAAVPLLREAVRRAPADVLAHKIYQQAQQDLDRWPELAAEYKANISSHPLDGLSYYLYASAVCELDELECDRVLKLGQTADPHNPYLAATVRLVEANELTAAGKPDDALALIGPTSSYPFPIDAIGARAGALNAAGRVDEAGELVRAVLKAVPIDPGLYLTLGDMASSRAKYSESLELYEKAQRLRPSAATLNALGSILALLGRRPESIKTYEAALTASHATLVDELGRGFAAESLGKKEVEAIAAAELDKRTKSTAMRISLIQMKFYFSDSPENLAELKRLRELYPDNQTLLDVDSNYRMTHGDCPGALPLFARLIKDNPTGYAAYQGKAYCDRTTGHPDEAIKTLSRGLAFLPKYYEFYRLQGEAYADMKEHGKAVQSFRRGLALNPNDGYTNYSLCVSLTAMKKTAEAVAACRAALKYAVDEDAKKMALDGLCYAQGSCVPPPAEREAAAKEIAVKYLPDASARFRSWKAEGTGYTMSATELTAEAIAAHLEEVKQYPNTAADSPLILGLGAAKPGELWNITLRPDGKLDQDIRCLVDLKKNWLAEIDENQPQ